MQKQRRCTQLSHSFHSTDSRVRAEMELGGGRGTGKASQDGRYRDAGPAYTCVCVSVCLCLFVCVCVYACVWLF